MVTRKKVNHNIMDVKYNSDFIPMPKPVGVIKDKVIDAVGDKVIDAVRGK